MESVYITDLSAWLRIGFGTDTANPASGAKLYLNGELVTDLVIPDDITSIKTCAFDGYTYLTSVTFHNNIKKIGFGAFMFCSGLRQVDIPNSVTEIGDRAFLSSGLTSVTIPSSVVSIGQYAFYDCASLTSVVVPSNETRIGPSAFCGCDNLISADIASGTIEYNAFYGCANLKYVKIAPTVTTIRSKAFYGCSSLEAIYITDLSAWCRISFDDDGSNPLIYSEKLYLNGDVVTDLEIPDDITSIGTATFMGYKGLVSVVLPDGVQSIGDFAFSGCNELKSITIPPSVKTIGQCAFKDCEQLEKVNISDLSTWFDVDLYSNDANPLGCGAELYSKGELVTDLVIPDNINTIPRYAFYGCSSITSVIISTSVTIIREQSFSNCRNLTSIVINPDCLRWEYSDIFTGSGISEVLLLGVSFTAYRDNFPEISSNADVYTFRAAEEAPDGMICKSLGLSIPDYVYNGSGPSDGIEITGNTSSYEIDCVGVDVGQRKEAGQHCAWSAKVRIYKKGADGQTVDYVVGSLPQKYYYLVNKAPLTVKAEPLAVEYGDPVTSDDFTLTYSGFIDGEDESVLAELPVANCEAGTLPDAGEHHIIVSGGDAKNYEFVYDNSGILTVVAVPLTGRIGDVEIEYGTEEIAFTDIVDYIEYSGFVNNDTEVEFIEAPEVLTTWTPDAEPGEYPIVLNGGKAKNYDVTFVPGTLTVIPASQSIVWTQSFDYDVYEDMEIELNATATSGLPVCYSTDNPHIAEIFIENGKTMMRCAGVGTVTITATQEGNTYYEPAESVSKTITILPFGGVGTVDAGAVGCYPNPAVERLNVTGTADDSVIRIFDLNGRLLGTLKGEDGTTAVDVSGLAQGDYLLVVATGGKTATLRFTKK